MKQTLSLLAIPLALAACAGDTGVYPSLAARPVEKLGFGEPEVKPVIAAADPALDVQIVQLATRLDAIATGFAKDARAAEALARAARGGAVGSDPWLTAQVALAGLDDWRAQSSALIGDIEQSATDRAAKLEPDYPALTALRDRASAEATRQGTTIARIQATLPAA
ncbi:hypothetical protein U1701_12265 [Sphingomonas sp. PB2P19]|uniref:hypothetical protein n=1 Tax=Sphingomonas rhamnosi TaxID=3096156 RepID=UPI002FCC5004